MNELLKTIYERKSVRNYQDKPVSDEIINELLKAGNQAPTGMNEQPWGYTIVRDKALIKEMSDYCKKKVLIPLYLAKILRILDSEKVQRGIDKVTSKELNIFYNAPLVIFVCARKKAFCGKLDAAAAAENILLAAQSLGLGSCWIGLATPVNRSKEIRRRLGIPDNYTIVAPIIVGYPDDASEKRPRQTPLVFRKI